MLRSFIIFFTLFISTAYGMEEEKIPSTQEDFNKFCAQISYTNYKIMNENVEFSYSEDETSTGSRSWKTVGIWNSNGIAEYKFFVKKRGVPLSKALDDLVNKKSQTSFACTTAMSLNIWKILSQFGIDDLIAEIENNDKDFFFPLLGNGPLEKMESYVNSLNFGNFTELQLLQRTRQRLNKLPILTAAPQSVPQNKFMLCETVEGGMLYLPNVNGVRGFGIGENLFCVDAAKALYYGFGDLFKEGPKTLPEIGKSLETYADLYHPGLYSQKMAPYLENLKESGFITEVKGKYHPLQYLVSPEDCSYLSLKHIREAQIQMNSDAAQQRDTVH